MVSSGKGKVRESRGYTLLTYRRDFKLSEVDLYYLANSFVSTNCQLTLTQFEGSERFANPIPIPKSTNPSFAEATGPGIAEHRPTPFARKTARHGQKPFS